MPWRSTKAGDKAAHDAVMWLALRLVKQDQRNHFRGEADVPPTR